MTELLPEIKTKKRELCQQRNRIESIKIGISRVYHGPRIELALLDQSLEVMLTGIDSFITIRTRALGSAAYMMALDELGREIRFAVSVPGGGKIIPSVRFQYIDIVNKLKLGFYLWDCGAFARWLFGSSDVEPLFR